MSAQAIGLGLGQHNTTQNPKGVALVDGVDHSLRPTDFVHLPW